MKKTNLLMWLTTIILSTLSIMTIWVYAQDPSDLDSLLADVTNNIWNGGYASTDKITVTSITNTAITISSPVVLDWDGNKIRTYEVTYANMPIADIDNPQFKFEKKTITITDADITAGKFNVQLSTTTENLNPDNLYYLNILPQGAWPNIHDVCFKLNETLSWEDDYCSKNETNTTHSSAWANMNLWNVTIVYNPSTKQIDVKWIALEWSNTITISELVESDWTWRQVGTANMTDESFSYSATVNGEHTAKLTPNNWWTEYVQTVTVEWTASPWPVTPWIVKVPVVWPKENMILIFTLTIAWYITYRTFRKAKN